jgi:hypothetical protein
LQTITVGATGRAAWIVRNSLDCQHNVSLSRESLCLSGRMKP